MATFELIEHIEVGSGGAASIEFTSISGSYTDLYLVISARTDDSNVPDYVNVRPNGSTSNLTYRLLRGSGSAAGSFTVERNYIPGALVTSNTFSNSSIYIPNYASSNAKSWSSDSTAENNATEAYQGIMASLWNDTTAISSLELYPGSAASNFVQYSSATLYGIRKYNTASAPKATGGIISYDATNDNWVHTFTASGTFTPTENLTAEYLVIAGGGGGGYNIGGGGGAGGYRCSVSGESSGGGASAETPLSLTASTGYTVTVGAGGNGATTSAVGSNGSNSVFSTITSTGGGGGAGESAGAAASGGSGGGGTYDQSGGAGTTNQGYAGGNPMSPVANPVGGGGGGGASEVGATAVPSYAGDGGDGVSSSITGSAVTRAGGGGGGELYTGTSAGAGGSGGGGAGGFGSGTGSSGTVNTGGGAGGGGQNGGGKAGGNGGSGIVIVRYAA